MQTISKIVAGKIFKHETFDIFFEVNAVFVTLNIIVFDQIQSDI